jgi:FAD/FMN-containing dehydrogenase
VISTNAGGVQVLRYGNTRELVLGLEVVLPDGQIWDGLRALRKDNTGYDLKQLFIGAEGTLGIVTAATLKLFAKPRQSSPPGSRWPPPPRSTCSAACARGGDRVTAFELISRPSLDLVLQHIPGARDPLPQAHPWYVLSSSPTPSSARPCRRARGRTRRRHRRRRRLDGTIAASQAQATALWSLRENISEAQKREGVSIKHDISVPVSAIPEFLDRAGAALEACYPACASSPSGTWATATSTTTSPAPTATRTPPSSPAPKRWGAWCMIWCMNWAAPSRPSTASASSNGRCFPPTNPPSSWNSCTASSTCSTPGA